MLFPKLDQVVTMMSTLAHQTPRALQLLNPQLSGLLFVAVHHLANKVRPECFLESRNSDANRLATQGLTVSSLLYWNYVMHSKYKGKLYALVCALDYTMISTNAIVSTFPCAFRNNDGVKRVMGGFAIDCIRHYVTSGEMNTYKLHHACCVVSTFVGVFRSIYTKNWSPILLRLYSTSVCSLIFYLALARMHSFKQLRCMPWYLPWMWHLHATICQQTSIEIAHQYEQAMRT